MNPVLVTFGIIGAVGLGLFLVVPVYVYLDLWFAGLRRRRQLAAKGRQMSLAQAKELISRGEGSILVDFPTLGWRVARVWWSSEKPLVPSEALGDDCPCSDEDHMNYNRLIHPDTGVAKIVCPFIFIQRLEAFLKGHFGLSEYVRVYSGEVLFVRAMKHPGTEQFAESSADKPKRP
jgi:hypothetical protein